MQALLTEPTTETGAQDAARLFMWTGFAAVLATCIYGLAVNRPAIVVASVLAMVGYVVVGWSLTRRDVQANGVIAGVALLTVTFTMALLGGEVLSWGVAPISIGLLPAIGVVLTYAAGAILARALVVNHPSLTFDVDDAGTVGGMIQVAAVLLVWSPFFLSYLRAPSPGAGIVALTGFLAAYASAAGQLARSGRVPRHVVFGSLLALLGSAWFIVQFSGLAVPTVQRVVGQVVALAAMLLSAFPVALGIVALQEARVQDDAVDADPGPDEAPSD